MVMKLSEIFTPRGEPNLSASTLLQQVCGNILQLHLLRLVSALISTRAPSKHINGFIK